MSANDEIKMRAAVYAADFVQNEMVMGIGSGSTVYWLIHELGKRVQQGLQIKVVPTSKKTAELVAAQQITLTDLDEVDKLALTIDGADEVDPKLQLIKGGGGALLQEKIVAAASQQLIIIVDESKLVQQLGTFPLPVEVIPFGYRQVQQRIYAIGAKNALREKAGQLFTTDHGHYILDCFFKNIRSPKNLNAALHAIPGVVETGLFIDMATKVITAFEDGRIEVKNKSDYVTS